MQISFKSEKKITEFMTGRLPEKRNFSEFCNLFLSTGMLGKSLNFPPLRWHAGVYYVTDENGCEHNTCCRRVFMASVIEGASSQYEERWVVRKALLVSAHNN